MYYGGADYEWEELNVNDFFLNVECAAKSIEKTEITGISSKIYDGNAQSQNLVVKYNDIILRVNKDYTVTYRNNINVGTATIIINGIGEYTGTKEQSFELQQAHSRVFAKGTL